MLVYAKSATDPNAVASWVPAAQALAPGPSPPAPKGRKRLFVIAGQSNAQSANVGPLQPGVDSPDSRIKMLSRGQATTNYQVAPKGEWMLAQHPIQHGISSQANSVSFGLQFAKSLLAAGSPEDEIYLIGCAVGGTGFTPISYDNVHYYCWDKNNSQVSNNLYWEMVTVVNQCLQELPDLHLDGVLWHQGETDIGMGKKYQSKLDELIYSSRQDFKVMDKNIPFICGTMLKHWKDLNPQATGVIDNIHKTTFPRVWLGECAVFDDLTDRSDDVHYAASSQRIMGERYAEKFKEVAARKQKALDNWNKTH